MGLKDTTIGRKDVRITIQSKSSTNHAETNEPVVTYATLATVWAEELGPISNENHEAKQQVAKSVARFRVRHSSVLASGLNEECRIVRGSDTFEVSGFEKIGRNSEYVITAEKRDNE